MKKIIYIIGNDPHDILSEFTSYCLTKRASNNMGIIDTTDYEYNKWKTVNPGLRKDSFFKHIEETTAEIFMHKLVDTQKWINREDNYSTEFATVKSIDDTTTLKTFCRFNKNEKFTSYKLNVNYTHLSKFIISGDKLIVMENNWDCWRVALKYQQCCYDLKVYEVEITL